MERPHVGGHLRICPLTVTTMARRSSRNVNRFPVRSAAEFAPIADYVRTMSVSGRVQARPDRPVRRIEAPSRDHEESALGDLCALQAGLSDHELYRRWTGSYGQ